MPDLHSIGHVHLYSQPVGLQACGSRELCGRSITTLACQGLANSQFEVSFEQTVALLGRLERMFVEMDGAFVWSGKSASQTWQIDGMLYDRDGHLNRIELKGHCPKSAWQELLPAFGWPQQSIVVHLIEHQCFVALHEFLECLRH